MQPKSTLKKIGDFLRFSPLFFILFFCFAGKMNAQTVSTTGFANNNANACITFNFRNNNASAVIITGLASICDHNGSTDVSAYYKASAINGAPGAINPGNGWNSFGSANI